MNENMNENTNENMAYVTCQICGIRKRELNSHIRMHNITMQEYKESFPNSPTICQESSNLKSQKIRASVASRPPITEETRAKMAKSRSKRWENLKSEMGEEAYFLMKRENAAKMRDKKGSNFKHSESTKEKMRGPRPQSRRPKTDEEKIKLSEAAKRRPTHSPHSDETKIKMKLAWEKRKSNTQAYNQYIQQLKDKMTTPESITRIRNAVSNRLSNPAYSQKQFDTKPELAFQRFVESYNISFIKQYVIKTNIGNFTYDFFLPDLSIIVEIDGEYWHSKTLEQINRDKLKSKIAANEGYTLARISDSDFRPDIIFNSKQYLIDHNKDIISKRLSRFSV